MASGLYSLTLFGAAFLDAKVLNSGVALSYYFPTYLLHNMALVQGVRGMINWDTLSMYNRNHSTNTRSKSVGLW